MTDRDGHLRPVAPELESPPERSNRLPRRAGHKRYRWRRILALVLLGLLTLDVGVTVAVFIKPDLGSVRHPQAVVVLGGYGARVDRGVQVAHADHVPTLVVSSSNPAGCPHHYEGLVFECFAPHPASTQGEGRAIARLARANHWNRLLVVAGTSQVARARLRIERCYGGQVAFAGVDPSGIKAWLYSIAYDQAAMLKAIVWQWGC